MQLTAGQIRNRISGSSSTKSSERGETVKFADIAGVDEAKEELEEIVVRSALIIFSLQSAGCFKGFFIFILNLLVVQECNFDYTDFHLSGVSSKSRQIHTTRCSSSSWCFIGEL